MKPRVGVHYVCVCVQGISVCVCVCVCTVCVCVCVCAVYQCKPHFERWLCLFSSGPWGPDAVIELLLLPYLSPALQSGAEGL